MFKQIFTAASLIFLFVSYANAGQSGYYAGASSGLMLIKSSLTDSSGSSANLHYGDIGLPISAFVGYQFGIGLRAEEELFYKNATANKFTYAGIENKVDNTIWSIGAMSNLYYDFFHNVKGLSDGPISPYMGLGIGFANVNMSEGTVNGRKLWNSGSDTTFAYQAAIGTGIPVIRNISLDISYRYFGTTNINIDQIKTDFNNHNFQVGVRYLFR